MSIWHPGDARGIPKPEPEASGLEGLRGKTSASFTLRRLFVCFLKSLLGDFGQLVSFRQRLVMTSRPKTFHE
ncbi:hypothetical protein EYF80_020638 [Liparis tanakae]|uniref:Uncharacterized protein n=1 Tax=Liparis tanakae TaxID=230148 RepID=A0A4Z2HUE7_9TELE|nr:hypothetical protein EYF80_020638 [Liparis tanakae]